MTGPLNRRRGDESDRDGTGDRSSTERADRGRGSTTRELQRRYGNQEVKRLVETGAVKLKPTNGRADSPSEREADRVARQTTEQTEDTSGTLNERIWKQIESETTDWKAVVSEIETASEEERKTFANKHKSTVHVLKSKLSREQFTTVCDALFEAGPGRLALRYLVEYRFNVKVGARHLDQDQLEDLVKNPGEFGEEGLKRIYGAYSQLPASHVGQIEVLVAGTPDATGIGERKITGGAHREHPWVAITYEEKHADKEIQSSNKFDGQNELAQKATHEVGEQVYDRGDFDKDGFLEISGWQRRGREWNVDDLLAATGNEIANADFKQYLADGVKNKEQKASIIKTAARESVRKAMDERAATNPRSLAAEWRTEVPKELRGGQKIIEQGVTGTLESFNIVQHVVRGHPDKTPWNDEPFGYLNKHQYHLPYTEGVWWRYDTAAQTNHRISDYQFRSPNDEFAELYALYYTDRGAVPKPLKKWFEREVAPGSGNSKGGGGKENGRGSQTGEL